VFTFIAQFFFGEPPQPQSYDLALIYRSPNLHAFFMFGLIALCMCLAPAVLALWKSQRQAWAVGFGLILAIGIAVATGGVYASGYSEARYPGLQANSGKRF
jgi:ABC-type transport system involved in multi-copper enzyme maturation permease subunit